MTLESEIDRDGVGVYRLTTGLSPLPYGSGLLLSWFYNVSRGCLAVTSGF